jgi:hypothetical protein
VQILCTLQNIKSFLRVFPSDLLPHSITRSGSIIVNTEPHTEKGSHWLAIHFEPKSSSAFYFDSYVISPIIPAIQTFLRRNCTVWNHNTVQLQGLTSTVCGQYCCLFTLYMDRGYTPKQFIGLFTTDNADRQVNRIFTSVFAPLRKELRGGQCRNMYKRYDIINKFIIVLLSI